MSHVVKAYAQYISEQAKSHGKFHSGEAKPIMEADEADDHKDTYDYHKSESEDGGPSEKVSKNHYRGEGDRGGIPFSYKHGNKHGSSDHDPEDSLSKIHKDIKSNNPHLSDSEIKHSAKVIHKHMSEMEY